MSGDYSRHSFDPRRHFSTVLMQQGRVALDADWNELCSIAERRMRAETVDIIGRCVVPKETPAGFQISIAGTGADKTLTIGRGRIYVHGLLAENHGAAPHALDLAETDSEGRPLGVLAELIGSDVVDYTEQPYIPNPQELPEADGPYLVYLDVWQREVTYVEDERILEKALGGVDTTTRLQTVWQVKLLGDIGSGVTCATPDAEIPGWPEIIAPSAGRLSSATVQVEDPEDPCLIPPGGGYKGLENQLYRVEIHAGGTIGEATFKWSRDNATVATNVIALPANDVLTVVRVGRDDVLRFNPGDWVEVTDDWRELNGLAGEMRQVQAVDDGARRITLAEPLPGDMVPSGVDEDTLQARHTRVRRWDQKGTVRDVDGNLIVDLDAPGSTGLIPVPAAGTPVVLENGVLVTFDLAEDGGSYRVGDLWNFAARAADASVEELDQAPPRAIHHHYCRLAIVAFPDTVSDCRVFWPPEFGDGGCGCSICVTPESHNTGTLTIQQAIDQVRSVGGTVCLDAGLYNLGQTPVQLDGARSVRLVGQGWRTILSFAGTGAAVSIQRAVGVGVEALSVLVPPATDVGGGTIGGGPGFLLRNALGVSVQRCVVLQYGGQGGGGAAIGLAGYLVGVNLAENVVFAPGGVASMTAAQGDDTAPSLLAMNLVVRDNLLACQRRGVTLDGVSLHLGDTRIVGNSIYGCSDGAIVATGAVAPGSRFDTLGNMIFAAGDGIQLGVIAPRVEDNDVAGLQDGAGDGIALVAGLDKDGVRDALILSNRLTGLSGRGIAIRHPIRSAIIKQNVIRRCGTGGIVMEAESAAESLVIDNNELVEIAPSFNNEAQSVGALRAVRVGRLRIAGNTIGDVARVAIQSPARTAIDILGCGTIHVDGNDIERIGPANAIGMTAGIRVLRPYLSVQVSGNAVRRGAEEDQGDALEWYALRVGTQLSPAGAAPAAFVEAPILLLTESAGFSLDNRRVRVLAVVARTHLGVQGNHFLSWAGSMPIVRVEANDSCNFGGNQCHLSRDANSQFLVTLNGRVIVVAGNTVRRSTERDAMNIDAGAFTVIGNVTFGNIRIRGTGLPAPWNALNVVSP